MVPSMWAGYIHEITAAYRTSLVEVLAYLRAPEGHPALRSRQIRQIEKTLAGPIGRPSASTNNTRSQ